MEKMKRRWLTNGTSGVPAGPGVRGLTVPGLSVLLLAGAPLGAQERGVVAELEVEPAAVQLAVGEEVPVTVRALDALGNPVDAEFRIGGRREAVQLVDGRVRGLLPGEHELVISLFPGPDVEWEGEDPPVVTVPVRVGWPALATVEVRAEEGRLYEGTSLRHRAVAVHEDGSERPPEHVEIRWSSSDEEMATVNRFGQVTARATGAVEIVAEAEGVRGTLRHEVVPYPAERLVIEGGVDQARAGDVVALTARAYDPQGDEIRDLPIAWSHTYRPIDSVGVHAGGSGLVRDGRFTGELPGEYTVIASAGRLTAQHTIEVTPRGVVQPAELVGQGTVNDQHTSDLWVWEGVDGRDYAITGTWGAGGYAYVWDVTDPGNIVKTDSIQVDARTVNDVKVSPDGRYATMTREGASTRRNGVVILDLAEPAHPVIAAEFDEGLTGGVHNAFPTEEHVFALSGGEKYVIIDVTDLYRPRYVSEFQYPGARIHDVWVREGIAYSAQRPVGGVMVDVGDGRWGGSPENPVLIGVTGPMPEGGGAHTVFPYYQESEDRLLLFLADEILSREGLALGHGRGRTLQVDPYDPETGAGGTPSLSSGYLHILDITDHENPEVIARYHVPEYGTHNTWVEDDVLYQAYWEGGVRMVDISGDLQGNLHTQDREIAVFKPWDPDGYIANAPFVWSAMPFKGHIFFSDYNSGLWAVQLQPGRPLVP